MGQAECIMVVSIANINVSEGIGTTIINVLKGSAQLVVGILDKSLDTSFGVTELGAVAIMLAVLAFAFAKAREAKNHGQALL